MRNGLTYLFCLLAFPAIVLPGCRKEKFLDTGGELRFSVDTLTFDTVFTALGSFTAWVKVYNPQGQPIKLSSVRLEGGDESQFSINVNGHKGNYVKDIEMAAKDSIYVFATVNIDPTIEDNPFVIQDRLIAVL